MTATVQSLYHLLSRDAASGVICDVTMAPDDELHVRVRDFGACALLRLRLVRDTLTFRASVTDSMGAPGESRELSAGAGPLWCRDAGAAHRLFAFMARHGVADTLRGLKRRSRVERVDDWDDLFVFLALHTRLERLERDLSADLALWSKLAPGQRALWDRLTSTLRVPLEVAESRVLLLDVLLFTELTDAIDRHLASHPEFTEPFPCYSETLLTRRAESLALAIAEETQHVRAAWEPSAITPSERSLGTLIADLRAGGTVSLERFWTLHQQVCMVRRRLRKKDETPRMAREKLRALVTLVEKYLLCLAAHFLRRDQVQDPLAGMLA